MAIAKPASGSSGSPSSAPSAPLEGCVLVFCGHGIAKDAKDGAVEAGAQVATTVSKRVTHVVVAEAEYTLSGKIGQAREKQIPIVHVQWVDDSIEARKKQPEIDYQCTPAREDTDEESSTDPLPTNGKRAKSADHSEDEDDHPPAKKAKTSKPKPSASPDPKMTKVVKKGVVPVDAQFPEFHRDYHVYAENGVAYDCLLNQTNISKNANKFYVMQILQSDKNFQSFVLLNRWGRVGESGTKKVKLQGCPLYFSQGDFLQTFKSKTGVDWSHRDNAKDREGKYTFIARSYDDADEGNDPDDDQDDDDSLDKGIGSSKQASESPLKQKKEKSPPVESKFDAAVQQLTNLIFSDEIVASTLSEMEYDATRLPLGKLTSKIIDAGYAKLSEIDRLLDGPGITTNDPRFVQLSSAYYTLIPHAFGRNHIPPTINTKKAVKRESELIDALRQMSEALKFKNPQGKPGEGGATEPKHRVDKIIDGLGLKKIEPVKKDTQEYKSLASYCLETQGTTHSYFSYTIVDIFRVEKEGDEEKFKPHLDVKPDNRQLLWHGSRVSNFGGILGQGLRIAPPEAPVSGYMFGKGIYLANMSSKSIQYCNASCSQGEGLLLLCEAQLGDALQMLDANYSADVLVSDAGKHSTHGMGQMAPSKFADAGKLLGRDDLCGVKMPQGKVTQTKTARTLMYDEHIVYSESQVRLRYLLRVKVKTTYDY